jgi:tetratricopeptide (TPR) repeat protein
MGIFLVLFLWIGGVWAQSAEGEALQKGIEYYKKQMYGEAVTELGKVIQINPRNAEAYYCRGLAYAKKGDFDQAISDYSKLLELDPNDASAYNNRAIVYFLKNEYDKSWEDVHKTEALGGHVHPGFLKELQAASGRES